MNPSLWIAIYLPIIIIFAQQRQAQRLFIKNRKIKRGVIMSNEMLKKYIGKRCKISTGSFGTNVHGEIIDIIEEWVEVQTRRGIEIINAEFIQSIKIDN